MSLQIYAKCAAFTPNVVDMDFAALLLIADALSIDACSFLRGIAQQEGEPHHKLAIGIWPLDLVISRWKMLRCINAHTWQLMAGAV